MKTYVRDKQGSEDATAAELGIDINNFSLNNHQLMAWMQELDINPYTLSPFSQ